jgi:hypothetical protein
VQDGLIRDGLCVTPLMGRHVSLRGLTAPLALSLTVGPPPNLDNESPLPQSHRPQTLNRRASPPPLSLIHRSHRLGSTTRASSSYSDPSCGQTVSHTVGSGIAANWVGPWGKGSCPSLREENPNGPQPTQLHHKTGLLCLLNWAAFLRQRSQSLAPPC